MIIQEKNFENYYINSIAQLAFLTGALNKRELKKLNKILEIEQDIMNLSVELINEYGLSHGMAIYDSIIASSCMVYDFPLWSYNYKDFRFLDIELVE